MKKKVKSSKPLYKKWWLYFVVFILIASANGSTDSEEFVSTSTVVETEQVTLEVNTTSEKTETTVFKPSQVIESTTEASVATSNISLTQKISGYSNENIKGDTYEFNGKKYTILEVDGGDLSGKRKPNVAVNIGFGDRDYWAFTNDHSQLVYVIASEIILQDEANESVLSNGRYYRDEAKVPGTELANFDEGHVIADSLGGVANAYNITPQDSILNRHGDQAYMEKVIRDAGGCKNFSAVITYQSTDTQIPLKYMFSYEINGNMIVDEFYNINPDEANKSINTATEPTTATATEAKAAGFDEKSELKRVDKNGNGKVTIAEAKAAGFKMPIYKDHWLYKYMDDRDGDGKVGE
jgi:hypothetical protein